MDNKTATALEKILVLKNKNNFSKAIEKISDLIEKNPQESQLYIEAIDICLEAGDPLKAWKIFKQTSSANSECQNQILTFMNKKVKSQNDPILAKLLMERAIRKRDLESGRQAVYDLENHTAKELLKRNRVKKKTLISSLGGNYALKGDLLINTYSEALLLLRVGRTKESMQTFVHILDDKPVENDVVEPFLLQLEKSIASNSSIHFALGCSNLISEQYRKAIRNFSQCIRINQAFLPDCIERIKQIRNTDNPLPEDLDLVLAEAYLMQSDSREAATLLMGLLDSQPEKSATILDLAGKFIEESTSSNELLFTYIEAAILSKQNTRAINQITALYDDPDQRSNVLDWLDRKYLDHLLPSDILMHYGKIALEQEMYDSAVSVLADVAEMSPVDVLAICRMLEEHQDADETVRTLRTKLSAEFGSNGSPASGIEHFERSEFSFSNLRNDQPIPLQSNTVELPSGCACADTPPDESIKTESGDATTVIALAYEGSDEVADEAADEPTEEPAAEETATPIPADDFDTRYKEFLDGSMEENEIISLIDDAFTQGEHEKLPLLLSFSPDDQENDMQRKLHLTRYHLLEDSPLEALAVIRSIKIDAVPKETKKEVLLKLAACYRRVQMYEAAHSALLKFQCEYPDSPVIDRLLQQNYSDYLKQHSSGAALIEKTGKLE